MSERFSERMMWWTLWSAVALGVLIYTGLIGVVLWGVFVGPPAPAGR